MLNEIFQKVMGFLQKPVKAFDAEKKTEPMEALIYVAIVSVVGAVMGGILTMATTANALMAGVAIIGAYVAGIVLVVISGLWLHLWAYIFGAKGGLNQTLKTVFYGGTPSYLLGWIPFIGILFFLWSLYLEWTGLQRLHGMPGDKAAFSIVVAFIIPLVVMAVLAMLALTFLVPFASQMEGFPTSDFLPAGF